MTAPRIDINTLSPAQRADIDRQLGGGKPMSQQCIETLSDLAKRADAKRGRMSQQFIAAVGSLAKGMQEADETTKPARWKALQLEKDFQGEAERFLRSKGYHRLTPTILSGLSGPSATVFNVRGFFGHWFESQRNAFMPDLLVIAYPNTRPALMLELKTRNKFQPGQKQAITLGLWRLAWSMDDVKRIVEQWENAPDQARAGSPSPESDCSAAWACPWCGCGETWFDRTIAHLPDGTEEGMKTRCVKCGRATDNLPNIVLSVKNPHNVLHDNETDNQ